jgi:hypothetical protein
LAQGVRREQILMVDQAGVIYRGREQRMNRYKAEFETDERSRTLAEAMRGADVFLGVSGPNLVTPDMVRSMADRPIVLARFKRVDGVLWQIRVFLTLRRDDDVFQTIKWLVPCFQADLSGVVGARHGIENA